MRREQRSAAVEHHDGVVALSGWSDARGEVYPAAVPEAEPAREWDDTLGQQEFSLPSRPAGIARIVRWRRTVR
jgi:hypothetical protein